MRQRGELIAARALELVVCRVVSSMLLDVRIVTRWMHELAIRQAASARTAAVSAGLPQPAAAEEVRKQTWCEQSRGGL